MGDDDAKLERRCQFHYAMPQGIDTCQLQKTKRGSTQHLLLSNGGGTHSRLPRIESTFREELNHQKERSWRKYVEVSRCIWPTSYYPWPAATSEEEFKDGVPILPELHNMVIDITAQHRLYTGSGIVSRKMLDDESRLVHSIAITNIIPRSQKNEFSERMKVFIYAFKNDIELDLPNIIIEEMIDASTKTATRSSLPFARLVMTIFTAASYKSIGSMLQTMSTRLGAIEGHLGTIEGQLETIEKDVRGLRPVQKPQESEYDSDAIDIIDHKTSSRGAHFRRAGLQQEKIFSVLEFVGAVMDELSNSPGPRVEVVNTHCREFMQAIEVYIVQSR
ncbi:hypothetical protein GIB67_005951 [Kingdonia uniflora]|uniref:Uncharacterized protein n=1 Tax=Kingdonia uniflora TaxID=39325 RepID=A0A7J7MBN7_9MAGN|nr:hypothetical protein GIB67_005951 [Kingdonia uniflora]